VRRRRRLGADPGSPFDDLFGSPVNGNPEPRVPRPWLTRFLLPLGAVLIAALTFLTQNVTLPKWAVGTAALYLVVVTVVTLYDPAVHTYRWLVAKNKLARLAGSTRPRIEETFVQLQRLLSSDNASTVLYVLKETAQWDELRVLGPGPLYDAEHLESLRGWLLSLESRVIGYDRREFASVCHELGALVGQYNRFCLLRHRALQDALTAGKLSEQHARYLKQQWNVHREGHAQFIRKWTEISATVNDRLGMRLCIDYYEALGTIE
jgi:hypothetical protein